MAKRLWDKGGALDSVVHAFTVGDDPVLDRSLVRWDAIASAAHAKMLCSVGILARNELEAVLPVLRNVAKLADEGSFDIPAGLEDCHTAIENHLVEKVGEPGKRIHAGRSRNDQVLVAMRLFMKEAVITVSEQLIESAQAFARKARAVGDVPMPGYTHMQLAMPSSVAQWLHAFLEWHLELLRTARTTLAHLDSNPLGTGSGFGVSLPLDRNVTTALLGFARVQRNPIDTQNSRGRHELHFLRFASDVGSLAEKFSWDCILYSMREFGFFSLPIELTTGSSIMPQKRNPDVLELLRATASRLRAFEHELLLVASKLPSNYHRDLQYTKRPVILATEILCAIPRVLTILAEKLEVNADRLSHAMSDELYATYAVFRKVTEGIAFRDAYRAAADELQSGSIRRADLESDFESIRTAGIEELCAAEDELAKLSHEIAGRRKSFDGIERRVFDL